jgi:predicted PurR-regulated permease PerM
MRIDTQTLNWFRRSRVNPQDHVPTAKAASGYLLLMAGFILGGFILWKLSNLLLLLFGAILVAILLRALAQQIHRFTSIPDPWSLWTSMLVTLLVIVGFAMVLGTQLRSQTAEVVERAPELLLSLQNWIGADDVEKWLAERVQSVLEASSLVSSVAGFTGRAVGIAANVLLVIVGGIYLAIDPGIYRKGVLAVVPAQHRADAAETMILLGQALKLWLLGQLLAMLLVGTLTAIGLWLLGVPSALALGFLAGLLEFVPYVGPVLSALPAVLVGLGESPTTALWIVGLYVLIQQLEGILIMPLVQQSTVQLPPVFTLFAIVAFGILLGPLGLIFATPLAVVCFVLVKKLWIRDTLEEKTAIPGEAQATKPKL